jgi:hypothetical protein
LTCRLSAILSVFAVALLATGCAPNLMLKNPQTGEVVTCEGGSGFGLGGVAVADRQNRCMEDFERQGYQRLPN